MRLKPKYTENHCLLLAVSLQGGLCSVYIQEVERTVSVPGGNLEPIIPEKNDKVGRMCQ